MPSTDGMHRVLRSYATDIGLDQDTDPSSVDPSLPRLMFLADDIRHVLLL